MMEAAATSETSENVCQTTRRNIPEDSHPHFTFLPYQEVFKRVNYNAKMNNIIAWIETPWFHILASIRHRTLTLKPPEEVKELLKKTD
jgi:hypothetical protein